MFCGIAPELIDPHAFDLPRACTTKVTDMFTFGMLAWEVRLIFFHFLALRYSSVCVGLRSSLENLRSPE